MAYVNRPGIADAPYEIDNEEILDVVLRALPKYERKRGLPRFAARTGVEKRRFWTPLDEVCAAAPYEVHNDVSVDAVVSLTVDAARQAMTNAGVQPHEVAVFIHAHATGQTVPSAADKAAAELGLNPDVLVIPMTELACAGGAHALAVADRLAQPGRPVLVAGAERLSSAFQLKQDTELGHMAFKFLFGDGGAAAVVTADQQPGRPCLEILDSYRYRLPGSLDFYRGRFDRLGLHFDSEREALEAVGKVVPQLPWLDESWDPEFGIVHPGSKPILENVTAARGASRHALRYSDEVLRTRGNYGGPTAIGVAQAVFDSPPPADALGLLMAFGPGFRLEASQVRWLLN